MGTVGTITLLLQTALIIAFLVWLVRLANRFVHAQEQSARAMQRIAQAAEQLAQAGLPVVRDERP